MLDILQGFETRPVTESPNTWPWASSRQIKSAINTKSDRIPSQTV